MCICSAAPAPEESSLHIHIGIGRQIIGHRQTLISKMVRQTYTTRSSLSLEAVVVFFVVQHLFSPAFAYQETILSAVLLSRNLQEQSLRDCLTFSGARVVFPGDSDYKTSRDHVFNHRYLYNPAAIMYATTTVHVQKAIQCAAQLALGVAPRCGGHSYEDYSLGGRDGVIVVDLEGMNAVKYNSTTRTATVGGGARLGPMKLALWEQGKVTIPSGTCPSVGVGGHSLGGGWGFISRKWGLMSDSMVGVEIVTANGTVNTASADENPDLYFAVRGAGANNFGIITQFTFNTYDVSGNVTFFQYNYDVESEQAQTIKAFQIWGLNASNDVSASLYHDPPGGNFIWGIYLGPKANLRTALQTFFDNAPPTPSETQEVETDYIASVLINGGFNQPFSISDLNLLNYTYETRVFKSKSIMVKGSGWSDEGIQAYITALRQGPNISYVIFDLFGGAGSFINLVPSDATAFVQRDSLFSIQMFTYWPEDRPENATANVNWIEGLWSAVRPYSSNQAYQNYVDSEMALSAYYGSNLDRLKSIKRVWDPENLFNYPKSIPLN